MDNNIYEDIERLRRTGEESSRKSRRQRRREERRRPSRPETDAQETPRRRKKSADTGPATESKRAVRRRERAARKQERAARKHQKATAGKEVATAVSKEVVATPAEPTSPPPQEGGRKRAAPSVTLIGQSRLRSVRFALLGTWLAVGGVTYLAIFQERILEQNIQIMLAGTGAALLLFTFVPWKRVIERWPGEVLLVLWMGIGNLLLHAVSEIYPRENVIFAGYTALLLVSGMLLRLAPLLVAATALISGYAATSYYAAGEVFTIDSIVRITALGAVAIMTAITADELRRQSRAGELRLRRIQQHQAQLQDREVELQRLYDVSRTIGAGKELAEVLPELVGRTAGYVGAKVGAVLLHQPGTQELVVLSPIWAAGQALDVDGYRLRIDSNSTAVRVFLHQRPLVANRLDEEVGAADDFIHDLGIERVAAVPLRIESKAIGVLLVADKETPFTNDDAASLQLLAAPASLVLDHLSRYELAQETSQRMAELAQLKSDFVSVVSHELRTPLTSVIGALSTLSRPEFAPDDETAASLLESARNQANRLRRLIEDLLTISRVDNQALPQRPRRFALDEFLSEVIASLPEGEAISLDVPDALEEVELDADHLHRVVFNLLENGRKYADGAPIEVVVKPAGNEVWISIVDHGPGVPYEEHERIFDRFTQLAHHETREIGGTGLGLSIVKSLTQSMGGRVWLEPTIGGGATFIVALPRNQAAPSAEVA